MWEYDPVKGWYKDGVLSSAPPPPGQPYWYRDKTGKWQNMTYVPGEPIADPTLIDDIGTIDVPDDTIRVDGKNVPRDDFIAGGAGVPANDPDPTGRTTGSDAPKGVPTGQPIDPGANHREEPPGSTATPPGMISLTPKPGYEYIGGGLYAQIPKTTSVSAMRPGDESRQGATIWNVGEDGVNRPEQVVTRDANGKHANEATPNTPATRGKITGWTSGAGETNGYVPTAAPSEDQYNQSHGIPIVDRLMLDGDPATRGRTTPYDSMGDSVKNTMSRQLVNSLNDVVRQGAPVVADGVVRKADTAADRARFIQDSLELFAQDPSRYETNSGMGRNAPTDPITQLGAYWDASQPGNQKPLQGREQRAKDKKAAMNGTSIVERLARGTFADPMESSPGQIDNSGWTGKGNGYGTADVMRKPRVRPGAPAPAPAPAPTPVPDRGPSIPIMDPVMPGRPRPPVVDTRPRPEPVLGNIPNPGGGGSVPPPAPNRPPPDTGSTSTWPRPVGQRPQPAPAPPYDPTRPGGDQGQRPNAGGPYTTMDPMLPQWRQRPWWRQGTDAPATTAPASTGGAGSGQGNFRYW